MRRDYSAAGTEPPLAELLADPIVQLLMRRDRLKPADVWRVVGVARNRLGAADADGDRSGPAVAGASRRP